MSVTLLFLAALQCVAPPQHISLIDRSSVLIEQQWKAVKKETNPAAQRALIKKMRLQRQLCTNTLDGAEWVRKNPLPIQLRDTTRYRTAIRPEMLATLELALRIFAVSDPGRVLTLGDVSQPGCGQIRYGNIVRITPMKDLGLFEQRSSYQFGSKTWWRPESSDSFADEYSRFAHLYGPIWVEERLTGKTRRNEARMEQSRFSGGQLLSDSARRRLLQRVRQRLYVRNKVVRDWVRHADENGQVKRHRRAEWIDETRSLWMEVIWKHRAGRRSNAWSILRVREGSYDRKKPGSHRDERRYLFGNDGEASAEVRKYGILYEAHHTSHLGGLDADISYVTISDTGHFDTEEALDAGATWRWLNAIYAGAKKTKVGLKALFVDPKILRLIRTLPEAKKGMAIWRKLKSSPGHDSHVHVRVASRPRYSQSNLRDLMRRIDQLFAPSK